ncbi:hypothetical protein ACHAWF_013636, partial [Thalassiosira exigua]
PDEIVEAGLAVRTRGKGGGGGRGDADGDGEEGRDEFDVSDLMDRFRGRLIVPILDERGEHVIALGGRYLEPSAAADDEGVGDESQKKPPKRTYAPAKYINSPESPAFAKKEVLFNRRNAERAVEEARDRPSRPDAAAAPSKGKPSPPAPAVVVVEGYFDAIALSNAGVTNVVASMGTALTMEQLKIAAEMGGRIVLCMDADDAGTNAVERLCASNILPRIPQLNQNELYVATLSSSPSIGLAGNHEGVGLAKDPSDYIDIAGGGAKAGEKFRTDVLDKAVPWDEWYLDRILSRHSYDPQDADERGGFAAICDEVSTFLAEAFASPAERTRRAHRIAGRLAKMIIAEDDNEDDASASSSSSFGMLRVQLESDILNMSSRKASVREGIERRIERTDGTPGERDVASRMTALSSGDGGHASDDALGWNATKKGSLARVATGARREPRERDRRRSSVNPASSFGRARRAVRAARSPKGRRTQPREERHLVPHFHGFTFKHQSDREWLGLTMEKSMHLGEPSPSVEQHDRLRAETAMFKNGRTSTRRSREKDVVYFNSNRYLGQQYLSAEAVRSGYQLGNDRPLVDESIAEFMDRKLFESADPDRVILQAESRLLHALAKFPQARSTMRTVYSSSTFGPSSMHWTSEEREWLFLCLTGSPEIDSPLSVELLDGGTPSQLRSCLERRQDCPENAFGRGAIELSNDHTASSRHREDSLEILSESLGSGENFDHNPDKQSENLGDNPRVDVVGIGEEYELDSFHQITSPQSKTEQELESEATEGCHMNGLLDEYFLDTEIFPSVTSNDIARETRAALTVQETVAALLRATAMKRFSIAKSRLAEIANEIDRRDATNEEGSSDEDHVTGNGYSDLSSEELNSLFQEVGSEAVEAQKSLYESERSSDRVNSHLLDYSMTSGVQYKTSQAQLERLDKMMEDHVASLPEDSHRPATPGNDGTYVFGTDEHDGAIDPMFGGERPRS